ncbi:unnamed protein product, partial [Discosporangium mesarthrocarpum]
REIFDARSWLLGFTPDLATMRLCAHATPGRAHFNRFHAPRVTSKLKLVCLLALRKLAESAAIKQPGEVLSREDLKAREISSPQQREGVCSFIPDKDVTDVGSIASSTSEGGIWGGSRQEDGHPSESPSEGKSESFEEDLGLVTLQPGQEVGSYRLQEHLGYLGKRPVHARDYAFLPPEARGQMVGYCAPSLLTPPLPWNQGEGGGEQMRGKKPGVV